MVMIYSAIRRLRKAVKKCIKRIVRKGNCSPLSRVDPKSATEAKKKVDHQIVDRVVPGVRAEEETRDSKNTDQKLELYEVVENVEDYPPTNLDQEQENPQKNADSVCQVETITSADDADNLSLSWSSEATEEVPKYTPYFWTPPVFDDITIIKPIQTSQKLSSRSIKFKFNHPLFDDVDMLEDFEPRMLKEKVLLEYCTHGHNNVLTGFVRVANSTFNKNIYIRFTYNNWTSTHQVTAKYQKSYEGNKSDQFVFEIPLRPEFDLMAFIIRYETDGCGTFTDNNKSRSYEVVME